MPQEKSLDDLFLDTLKDIYYAEKQILKALPKMAKAAQIHVAAGDTDPFYANKLITGQYFLDRLAPEGSAHLAKLKSGAEPLMALPADAF